MILITGAAGYIGSCVLKIFLNAGYNCIALDNLSHGYIEAIDKRAIFLKLDLEDKTALRNLFLKYSIDCVIHLAATSNIQECFLNPNECQKNNIDNTLNLLNVMKEFSIKKFIFASSAAVYDDIQEQLINENSFLNPKNEYGKSKLEIERYLEKSNDFKYIILRCFNVAGAMNEFNIGACHTPATHLIPRVIKSIVNDIPFEIYGVNHKTLDGSCVRDYVHVEDVALAYIKAYNNIDKYSGVLNVGSSKGYSVKEIIDKIEKIIGKKCTILEKEMRKNEASSLIADISKAKQVLDWQPKNFIEEIIKSAYEWESNRRY